MNKISIDSIPHNIVKPFDEPYILISYIYERMEKSVIRRYCKANLIALAVTIHPTALLLLLLFYNNYCFNY